ncbi:unnamed protein product [Dracunculus medinensis]|uniref:Small ribosomal subunit protein mS25 n=1 Tax=Dracunculus medinensis TaxID=318479 RepID=A0A0N4U3J8_DRAME|nr:unnamed protein product [Dracunculus medinensis]
MPFMHGSMPLRRTYFYLNQGTIFFRDVVKVLAFGFHRRPTPEQKGARDFIFWHWAQLQFQNPKVQLVKYVDFTPIPFVQAFLDDGREVLFDLDGKSREEIIEILKGTLGKTNLVLRREKFERVIEKNPSSFGEDCSRQCICTVQGQYPCTGLLAAPDYLKGTWRWHKNCRE